MRQHIDILGWLFIVMGGLGVLTGLLVFVVLGVAGGLTGDLKAGAIVVTVGLFVACLVSIMSVPNFVVGWGLLKRKSWSRIAAIILGCLGLLSFPFGTALGIYTLWALTQPEAERVLTN